MGFKDYELSTIPDAHLRRPLYALGLQLTELGQKTSRNRLRMMNSFRQEILLLEEPYFFRYIAGAVIIPEMSDPDYYAYSYDLVALKKVARALSGLICSQLKAYMNVVVVEMPGGKKQQTPKYRKEKIKTNRFYLDGTTNGGYNISFKTLVSIDSIYNEIN